MEATGLELHRLALHAYSYLHLPMVAGVVFALGLKTTLGDVGTSLDTVPAIALCGGAALLPARAHRLPLPRDALSLPAADGRGGRLACPRPRCRRDPGPCGARARERRVLTGRGLRSDPLPRGPDRASTSRARRRPSPLLLVAGCDNDAAPRKSDLLVFGVAPDYDEIAYDIVAVRPDGRGRRILTRGMPGDAHYPLWSPDGRHIAFDLTESVPPESTLYVMDADGTDRRRLVPKRDGHSHLVGWSPTARTSSTS